MSKADKLTGAEKAAILLLTLGEDLASDLLGKLDTDQAKRILVHLTRIQRVDGRLTNDVIDEFLSLLNSKNTHVHGSKSTAKSLVEKAFSGDMKESLSKFIDESAVEITALDGIADTTAYRVLKNEHPQTIALILSHIDPVQSSGILKLFPELMQIEIIMRISSLSTINPSMIDEINEQLKQDLSSEYHSSMSEIGGNKKVAAILNAMNLEGEELLEQLGDRDPDKMEAIKEHMIGIEDIEKLTQAEFQDLFKVTDYGLWVLAGRAFSDDTKLFLRRNLSQSRFEAYIEDVDLLGKQTLSSVKEAEKEILKKAFDLHEAGIINLKKGDEKWVV